MNSSSINILIDELANATGMKFEHYQRKFLEKRIYFRMKNLNLQYHQQYIRYIRNNPDEIDLFLDKFTINYTYFFRNYNVFENFEKFIKIYSKDLKRPLKIWSAPCATGDEPYSIAIILDQLKKKNKSFPNFHIIASDIDSNALKFAKRAVYGEYSLHETPQFYIESYFFKQNTNIGPKYILNKEIKEKVEFIQEDIIKGHIKEYKYDVVFCRNLLIYVNQYAREKLLRILEARLYNGGLLVLGGSEALKHEKSCFENLSIRNRFYVKDFSMQNESTRKELYRLFETRKKDGRLNKTEEKYQESLNKGKNQPIEIIKEKPIKIEYNTKRIDNFLSKIEKDSDDSKKSNQKTKVEKKIEKQSFSRQIKNKGKILEKQIKDPTEVKITGLIVNNGVNKTFERSKFSSFTNKVKLNADKIENPFLKKQKKLLNQREDELRKKEISLERREEIIKAKVTYLNKKKKKLELKKKKIKSFLRYAKEQENEVEKKWKSLEELIKHVEKRNQLVAHREKQLQLRVNQLDKYSQQIIQREVRENIHSCEIDLKNKDQEFIQSYEDERFDRILRANDDNELAIPMGYYALINSFDKNVKATKFSIKGLGSGLGLILKDPINNIFAISHIQLPVSTCAKQGYHLLFPHTFVDTSIKDLYNNLLYHGAKKANIKAIIVGGARLFMDYDKTYQENIDNIKEKLGSMNIKIEIEEIGGLSERSVIYDTINDTLYVKKTWEFQYRQIV
ncbi:MAG: CheR family methyltransferase [Promethearchaeota archaeon]